MQITNGLVAAAWTVGMIGTGTVIGQATRGNDTTANVAKGLGLVGVAAGMTTALSATTAGRSLAGIVAAGIGAGLLLGASN